MKHVDCRGVKDFDGHELVVRVEEQASGLSGFIAIHRLRTGFPSLGGTRFFAYASQDDALSDVLRLSRAMTYKCVLAGLPYGGAKGVIIGNPQKDKTEALLRAYARAVNELEGKFRTGEDVGISQEDVNVMLQESDYFVGKPDSAGDPSPYAALSAFYAMETAAAVTLKKESLRGVSVAIKGVGKVGGALAKLLADAGANVFVSDIDPAALARVTQRVPLVQVAENEAIHSLVVDVYAPCALGNDFSADNIAEVQAKIICGAANNQLADETVGDALFEKGITYIPDYIANAGGLINVADELEEGGYSKPRVLERVKHIQDTVQKVLELSAAEHRPPHRVSNEIAEEMIYSFELRN